MLASMPLKDALNAYLMGGLEWGQTEMGLVRFFGRAAYQGDPDLAERVVRPIATVMRETLQEILAQAKARGELRSDVDIETATRIVNALIIAVSDSQLLPYLNNYFQISDNDIPFERMMGVLIEFILHGIGVGTE